MGIGNPKSKLIYELTWEFVIKNNSPLALPHWLYHYTSNAAKELIVSDKGFNFRLTKSNALNDKNEGSLIFELLKRVCGALYNDNEINKYFYVLISGIRAEELFSWQNVTWIFCATPNACSKSMKERYAPRDGWVIRFTAHAFNDLVFSQGVFLHWVAKIIYKQYEIEEKLKEYLLELYACYKNERAESNDIDRKLRLSILNMLSVYNFSFKSSDFQHEEEIRLMIRVPEGFTKCDLKDNLRLYMENGQLYLFMGGTRYCSGMYQEIEHTCQNSNV